IVQERFERLTALQDRITHEENLALEGRAVEILVSEGEGTRDARTDRLSGRSRDHRLVHFSLPEGITDAERPRPGDLVTATVTRAAPHYLIADSASGLTSGTWPDAERFSVRRTRSGDAWEAGQLGLDAGSCGTGGGAAPSGPVTLGMPTLRAPRAGTSPRPRFGRATCRCGGRVMRGRGGAGPEVRCRGRPAPLRGSPRGCGRRRSRCSGRRRWRCRSASRGHRRGYPRRARRRRRATPRTRGART